MNDSAQDGAARDAPVGGKVGRVRIEARIGQGGMGDVFRGFDEVLERPVALKRLRSARRDDPLARTRFLREARLLSRLDHPNVCRIWDLLETEDGDYLVLELVEGRPLDRLLAAGELDDTARWRIGEQIAAALAAAHAQDIVHRDLKPANVVVTPEGEAKVLDFGIARPAGWSARRGVGEASSDAAGGRESPAAGGADETWFRGRPRPGDPPGGDDVGSELATRTTEGTVLGSLRWMSPEQARGEPVGPASDVFSLGLLLGTLLTDTIPHEGVVSPAELLERATGRIETPRTDDPALRRLLRELLAADPADRPTAAEAAERIRNLRDRDRRRRRWIATAVASVILLAAAVLLTLWASRPSPLVGRGEQLRIAVLPFLDSTERSGGDWMELGLAEILTEDLAARPEVSAVPVDEVRSSRDRLAAEVDPERGVLRALGANLVVRATVEEHPRGILLRAGLTGRDGRHDEVEAIAPDPVEAARLLATGIANRLDIPPAVDEASTDAFALQALATGIQRRAVGEPRTALFYFHVALDRDPLLERARLELAEALNDTVEVDEALALLSRLAEETDREATEARALVAAFRILLDRGRTEEAEEMAERAVDLLETLGAEQDLVQALNQLGVLAYRRSDLDLAEARWSEARSLAEKVGASAQEADALRNLAYVELRRDEVEAAEALLRRSLDLFRSLGIPRGELTVLGSLGLVANQIGDLETAESLLLEAHEIARSLDAPRMEMTGLVNLGAVAFARGDLQGAIDYTRKALELGRELEDPRQQVHALASLGYYATRSGSFDRAADHLEEAERIAASADVTDAAWILQKNLAYLLCRQGRDEEASRHLDVALGDRREKFGLLAAARCEYHGGDPGTALSLLEEARESVGPTGGWTAADQELARFLAEVVADAPDPLPPLPDEAPPAAASSPES